MTDKPNPGAPAPTRPTPATPAAPSARAATEGAPIPPAGEDTKSEGPPPRTPAALAAASPITGPAAENVGTGAPVSPAPGNGAEGPASSAPLAPVAPDLAARASGALAGLGVLAMLAGAGVITADVVLRWLGFGAVTALNEIMSQLFAAAVALTLPAGAARRVNLRVDLLAGWFGPRATRGLACAGSAALALMFAVMAWRMAELAAKWQGQGRATLLLDWPLAPTGFAVAAGLGLAALLQLRNAGLDLSAPAPGGAAGATRPGGWALIGALTLALLGAAGWIAADPSGAQRVAMTEPALASAAAFLLLWLAVFAQAPIAAATGLLGLGGAALFIGWGAGGNVFAADALAFLSDAQVATLPLFLLMGGFAAAAGASDDIYRLAGAVLGRARGGLAYATVAGCAGFGAVSGSSVATAAAFGRIALPQMAARGYAPGFAAGVTAAGGTLGALVPPSGAVILFALLTEQSIADLFIAAILPALLALSLYFAAIAVVVRRGGAAPAPSAAGAEPLWPALRGAAPVGLLFGVVIGGLYGGVFTATESAAVGAAGAFLTALLRGRLRRGRLLSVMAETTQTTALVYGLIFGALIFSFFVNMGQAPDLAARWIAGLDARPILIIGALVLLHLALGAVMDSFAVMIITVPVVTPIVTGMGYDMVWWGVVMLAVVELGLITPPFGVNLFVLKSLSPGAGLGAIMRGALPFVAADLVKIALLLAFPALALWLPETMR